MKPDNAEELGSFCAYYLAAMPDHAKEVFISFLTRGHSLWLVQKCPDATPEQRQQDSQNFMISLCDALNELTQPGARAAADDVSDQLKDWHAGSTVH